MAEMFNPSHPGLTLRDDVLPALGLSLVDAARQLNVDPTILSNVLDGRAPITVEMALRIETWLGVARGGSARVWLAEQSAYDLWQARQHLADALLKVQHAPSQAASSRA